MAVPKFKVSKSKQRKRRTHDRIRAVHLVPCESCGANNPPHTICSVCGTYAAHGKKGSRSRLIQVKKSNG